MPYSEYFTEDDCRTVLRNVNPEHAFRKYTLKPFCADLRGYLGDHLLLTVELTGGEELTFFVKSTKTASLSECYEDGKFFEREVLVYQFYEDVKKILPKVPIHAIPKYLHSNKHEMLVLENLAVQGYTGGQMQFDEPHMLKAIEALAKFHSVSLAYEEHRSAELGRRFELTERFGDFPDPLFKRNKESSSYKGIKSGELGTLTLIDLFFEPNDAAAFKEQFLKTITKIYKLMNEKTHFRKVMSNGDLWGFNTVFKYENGAPVDCKLIDFQFVRYVPPASDLTMLIYFTSDKEQYQRSVHKFYDHYYTSLTHELRKLELDIAKVLPWKEFQETCKLHTPCAKIIWLLYRQLSQAKHLSMADVSADMNLFKSVILGKKRVWYVTENYKNDAAYRDFIGRILHDCKDIAMNDAFAVEECYKVVENTIHTKDYEFLDYTLAPLSERGGFLGEHYNLKIRIKRKEELVLYYFVKLPPFTESRRCFAEDTGAMFKETRYYTTILPDFKKKGISELLDVTPHCYLVQEDCLVLDDLKSLGYVCLDKRKSLDLRQAKIALRGLAKMHASGLVYEERFSQKLNKTYQKEFEETFYQTTQMSMDLLEAAKNGLKVQIEMFSNYTSSITPEDLIVTLRKLIDAFRILIVPSKKFRNTICHGDLWVNNMLFGEKLLLVDFQSYRYCPPAHDVMQFIFLSTDREFRKHHLQDLLDYYHAEISAILDAYGCDSKAILSREDFIESCEQERPMAVIQSVTHFHNILMSAQRMEDFFADEEYCRMSLYEDRSHHIKFTAETDPVYRLRNKESITDARELCEELFRKRFNFDKIVRV